MPIQRLSDELASSHPSVIVFLDPTTRGCSINSATARAKIPAILPPKWNQSRFASTCDQHGNSLMISV
jgi:hypothetical protein